MPVLPWCSNTWYHRGWIVTVIMYTWQHCITRMNCCMLARSSHPALPTRYPLPTSAPHASKKGGGGACSMGTSRWGRWLLNPRSDETSQYVNIRTQRSIGNVVVSGDEAYPFICCHSVGSCTATSNKPQEVAASIEHCANINKV